MKIMMNIEADTPGQFFSVLKQLLAGEGQLAAANVTVEKVAVKEPEPAKTEAPKQTRAPRQKPAETKVEPEVDHAVPTGAAEIGLNAEKEAAAKNGKTAQQKKAPSQDGAALYSGPALPDEIKNASAMRELLVWLSESGGVKDVDQMVDACKALKDVVPILGRVPDVDSRVRRAVEMLDLFSNPADDATS